MTATLPEVRTLTPTTLPVVFDARVVTGSGGGPDKTILNSPRFLEPLGYRMLCGYLTPPNDPGYAEIEAKAAKYNAPLITVPDRGPWDVRIVRNLLRVLKRERVAIWHGHDYKSNALGLLLRKFHRMKLVTTVHGWVQKTTRLPFYYKVDKWCLPRYERVYCVSDDLFAECKAIGVQADKLVLLENAIDTDDYLRRQTVAQAKAKLNLPANTKLIGAVGRLSEEKAFDELIRAVTAIPDVSLMIVGEGHDRPRLEALVKELNITTRVTLPGWRSDVRDVYEACDVLALSSHREGLPNVLLEALALEVPVVSTNVNGIPRLITHNENGLLVNAGDVPALNSSLTELLGNDTKCDAFRRNGRRTVEDRFSFPARMKILADDYDTLLAGGRS
ncbi:N/A [soil metagenome]